MKKIQDILKENYKKLITLCEDRKLKGGEEK